MPKQDLNKDTPMSVLRQKGEFLQGSNPKQKTVVNLGMIWAGEMSSPGRGL